DVGLGHIRYYFPFPGAIPESRADYSRVTHPFAARVPRRAFPLDLHVLSTPPAFVLSQDQTLQQNLCGKIRPDNKQSVAKGIPQNRSEEHTSELKSPDHLVCRLLLEI